VRHHRRRSAWTTPAAHAAAHTAAAAHTTTTAAAATTTTVMTLRESAAREDERQRCCDREFTHALPFRSLSYVELLSVDNVYEPDEFMLHCVASSTGLANSSTDQGSGKLRVVIVVPNRRP